MDQPNPDFSLENIMDGTASNPADYLAGLNERQREAVLSPADQPLQVLAGAGTGKTELIARRFLHLANTFRTQGIETPEDRILVLTFTNDAAQSMRKRIDGRLRAAGHPGLSPDAWIGTFHQLCLRILRENALLVDLPPNFRILDTLEQQILFRRTMHNVLAGFYGEGASSSFRQLCSRAGLPEDFPADILSVKRLQALASQTGMAPGQGANPEINLEQLLDPQKVLGLIQRIKSAGLSPAEFRRTARQQSTELTQAIAHLPLPHNPELSKVDNIRQKLSAWRMVLAGWAYPDWDPLRIAEEKAERNGKDPAKVTPSDYKKELKELSDLLLQSGTYEPSPLPTDWPEPFLSAENLMVDLYTAIYVIYQEALLSNGACDFDDLTNRATHLLMLPEIGQRYRDLFDAVIVDEFQDSNNSQLALLEQLTRPKASNLTVVGDEKQSIYAFRFAQPENLELVFRHGKANRVSLQTNYRSRPPVLSAANAVTKLLTPHADSLLQAAPANSDLLEPQVIVLDLDLLVDEEASENFVRLPKGKSAKKPSKEPVHRQKEWEARFIAAEIARLVREDDRLFSDIAILVPSHDKADQIHQVLTGYGIPAVKQKNRSFFSDPTIKNAMAVMRLLRNPANDGALVRLLQSKLSWRQLKELVDWKRSIEAPGLLPACLQLGTMPAALPALPPPVALAVADLARRIQADRPVYSGRLALRAFENLSQELGLIDPALPEWQQKEQRIRLRTFGKLLYAISRAGSPAPSFEEMMDFLEAYAGDPSLELPVSETPGDEDAVRILTTFAAKGLEFPVTFAACTETSRAIKGGGDTSVIFDPQYDGKNGFGLILGKINGQPSVKADIYRKMWQGPRAEREAQRVFYVALTRARESLYVVRGSSSFPWTAPRCFPASSTKVFSQTRDHKSLDERYWRLDPTEVREGMAALQESRKSRILGDMMGRSSG